MAITPEQIFQQVTTYAPAALAYLENTNCYVNQCNTKFKTFNNETANLGDQINIQRPGRATVKNGLVASFQGVEQLSQPLICDQAANSANAFNAQQFVFNTRQFMEDFNMARINELSTKIEYNVGLNSISAVPVMTVDENNDSVPTGALHTESGPYRFFGDGVTSISSFGQLARMEELFRDFGAAPGPLKVFFSNMAVVDVINSGLNQFALDRNNELANSWDLGSYKGSNARYFKSNLLPIHYAGNVGNDALTLTVVSTVTDSSGAITGLVLSGAGASDPDAIKSGDLLEFQDGVSGQPNIRFLTYTGHIPCQNHVQIRVLENAQSNGGGQVTISITPPLQSAIGLNQNISSAIAAGMQVKALPNHRAGMIVGGDAFYLAMPPLPDEIPFPSSTATNKATGVSLRNYYGSKLGQNQRGYVNDCIWASTAIPDYTMRVVFPM